MIAVITQTTGCVQGEEGAELAAQRGCIGRLKADLGGWLLLWSCVLVYVREMTKPEMPQRQAVQTAESHVQPGKYW